MSGLAVSIDLPDALLEEIVSRLWKRVLSETAGSPSEADGWIRGATKAAGYLDCPPSRIYALVSQGMLPHRKDGSALVFSRAELDAFINGGGARAAEHLTSPTTERTTLCTTTTQQTRFGGSARYSTPRRTRTFPE
jgi:excisionase family DNA binding protein